MFATYPQSQVVSYRALPRADEPVQHWDGVGLGEVDGLFSSIKKVVKKVAPIALPVAGIVAAPFTGGASLAIGAAGSAALMASKRKKAQKKADKEAEEAQEEYNRQMLATGMDPYATAQKMLNPGQPIQKLVPTVDPTTGKITYVMQEQSFFEEYKTPLLIGGALLGGGLILYNVMK